MSRYLVFSLVAFASLMGSVSSTSIAVAFPVIVSSFNASLVLAGWVLSANQLVATAVMPVTGKASDIFGGRRTFMILMVIFVLGSFLCAIAQNIQMLIFARIIQAIGSGGFMPSSTGIVADCFPRARRQALGFLTTILPTGQIIGPVFGGWVINSFGWQAVFWVNLPLGIISLVAAAFLIPEGEKQKSRIDFIGAALFASSLCTLMIGLSGFGSRRDGIPLVFAWLLIAVSAVMLLAFMRHERTAKAPIIDLEVLTRRPFMSANIFNFVYGACLHGTSALIPLYAVTVYGMSTFESGIILTPKSIGMLAAGVLTSFLLARLGYRKPMLAGSLVVALSLTVLGVTPGTSLPGITLLITALLVMGLGMGMTGPAANNACIELMPRRIATISGIRGMFRQSGGAVSITVASILLQNAGNLADAFRTIFVGLAVILVLTFPFVFIMTGAYQPETQSQGD